MLTPQRAGRGYRWAAMALFVLAGTSVVLAGISLFTETYVSGPDGDVGCRALPVTITWGDGLQRAPEGYEDECRSSASEDIGSGLILAGVAGPFAVGGVLCRRAARKAQARAPAETSPASPAGGQPLSLQLGNGWGPARAELSGEALSLIMPGILGKRRWTIPMSEITVVDPLAPGDAEPQDVVLVSPLTLPELYAAPAFPRRRLTLLFSAPQRLPAFRWFWAMGTGVSPRQTRSTTGVWADGVVLGFRPRPAVVTAFVQAGARLTPSEMAWAQGHRPVVVDPVERRRIARNQTWLLRAFYVLLPLALGARILVAMDDTSPWGLILFGGAVVLILVLSRLAPRLTGRR